MAGRLQPRVVRVVGRQCFGRTVELVDHVAGHRAHVHGVLSDEVVLELHVVLAQVAVVPEQLQAIDELDRTQVVVVVRGGVLQGRLAGVLLDDRGYVVAGVRLVHAQVGVVVGAGADQPQLAAKHEDVGQQRLPDQPGEVLERDGPGLRLAGDAEALGVVDREVVIEVAHALQLVASGHLPGQLERALVEQRDERQRIHLDALGVTGPRQLLGVHLGVERVPEAVPDDGTGDQRVDDVEIVRGARIEPVGEQLHGRVFGARRQLHLEPVRARAAGQVHHPSRRHHVVRTVAGRLDLVGRGRAQGGKLPEHVEPVHGVQRLAGAPAADASPANAARGVVADLLEDVVAAVVRHRIDHVDVVDLLDAGAGGADQRRPLDHLHLLDLGGGHLHEEVHLGGRVDADPDVVLQRGRQLGGRGAHLEHARLEQRQAEATLGVAVDGARASDLGRRGGGDLDTGQRRAGLVEHAADDGPRVTSLGQHPAGQQRQRERQRQRPQQTYTRSRTHSRAHESPREDLREAVRTVPGFLLKGRLNDGLARFFPASLRGARDLV